MLSKFLLKVKNNKSLLLVWITLTSTAPFILYSWPGHPYKLLTLAGIGTMTVQILLQKKQRIFDFKIFSIIILQIAYYLFATFYHSDFSNINLCIQLISFFIIITYINAFIGFRAFVRSYIGVMLAMAIGGTLIFFLHAFIGVKPLFFVDYSATGTSYFLWLTTTNVYYDVSGIRFIRYSGFFDEPGAFGLYSFFAIVLNKIYFNNVKKELWLILLTAFTLSLAFYISIVLYFLFFYVNKSNLKYIALFFVGIVSLYFYLNSNKEDETTGMIYDSTFKRFEMNDSGLAENNRSALSDNDKKVFLKYPMLGAGSKKEKISGSNLFSILATYGIFGSLFYYALLLYFIFQIILMSYKYFLFYLKILLLILINFYSRPEISSVFTLLVFVSIIYYIRYNPEIQNRETRSIFT